jgi:uncharacterized protein with HEPN domain
VRKIRADNLDDLLENIQEFLIYVERMAQDNYDISNLTLSG